LSTTAAGTWVDANQRYLLGSLARIRDALHRYANGGGGDAPRSEDDGLRTAAALMTGPPAVEGVTALFGLSPFERDVLLLCAGVELDSAFAARCAEAQDDPRRPYPTFGLALAALPDAHWSALAPTSPLRRWRLIEVAPGDSLTQSRLRIDERVLHYLTGVQHLDERLLGLVGPVPAEWELPPSHRELADRIVGMWSPSGGDWRPALVQLNGPDRAAMREIAAAACGTLGMGLHEMRAADVPAVPSERDAFVRLWEREAVLSASALLLLWDSGEPADRNGALALIEGVRGPVAVAARDPIPTGARASVRIDVRRPTAAEQLRFWSARLQPTGEELAPGRLETVVAQFDLGGEQIRAAASEVLGRRASSSDGDALWEACRAQARPRLDDLAQRVPPTASWDDLVLPDPARQLLREVAIHVRRRATVYGDWGFAAKSARGLGISALFAGPSGTGKTMAAEVLAGELRLDLYRIDLSQVVSKYIGETEKNLRRVFDAAEDGGAVLLFDEADALFGKRSEVKDSHDRYANIEVGFLLQRMEAYRGLAILTTNMKEALDQAFLRRIRFVVQFPFPDAYLRAEIWRRVFPAATPLQTLDFDRLARLNVAGGNIRNIALGAAFLAAEAGEPVGMSHLLRAARAEYAKLEKPLTDAEIGGWV
jgi:hypothetical protein